MERGLGHTLRSHHDLGGVSTLPSLLIPSPMCLSLPVHMPSHLGSLLVSLQPSGFPVLHLPIRSRVLVRLPLPSLQSLVQRLAGLHLCPNTPFVLHAT